MLAVAEQEGGKPGQWVHNTNGTHVVGVNYLGRRIDSSDLLPELTCCLT